MFQVGDIVECVTKYSISSNTSYKYITIGQEYKIWVVSAYDSTICITGDDCRRNYFLDSCFIKSRKSGNINYLAITKDIVGG